MARGVLALLPFLLAPAAAADGGGNIVLSSGELTAEFTPSGTLVRLAAGDWELINDTAGAGIAIGFRALLPIAGATPPAAGAPRRRFNYVYGDRQPSPPTVNRSASAVAFTWDKVTSEHGGEHDLRVTVAVELQGGSALWTASVTNNCNLTVENFYWPYLGDVAPPPGSPSFQMFTTGYSDPTTASLYPEFPNGEGYFGDDYSTQILGSDPGGTPKYAYTLLHDPGRRSADTGELQGGRGMYVGLAESHGDALWDKSGMISWVAELRPGYLESIGAGGSNTVVPRGQLVGGKPVCTPFAAVHLPYILPGSTRDLSPVVMEPFMGGWQVGVDIQKRWLAGWLKLPPLPVWAREPHSWQQIQLNDPEDKQGVSYKDFAKVGAMAAKYGVKAIQVTGWNWGGQDQGNPLHSTDPRLGTHAEFKAAIAATQKLGVKVILFTKFLWADQATEWYRDTLIKYASKDPYGDPYQGPGYKYSTVTQWLDINTKRLISMCFLSENYQRVVEGEFAKELDLEPDGILQDECQHHVAQLCFDTTHGHRYGASVYAEDRALIHKLAAAARAKRGNGSDTFLFAGESPYEWEYDAYHLGYLRSQNPHHVPIRRYTLPDVPIATAIIGFNDRNMLNQCLMYKYIASYEPYNFHGQLDAFPETLAYGAKVDALRRELREYFWDGEFRFEAGADVACVDPAGYGDLRYSVFRAASVQHRGCGVVVANYGTVARRARVAPTGECAGGALSHGGRYRLVDAGGWEEWAGPGTELALPPRSALVLVPRGNATTGADPAEL